MTREFKKKQLSARTLKYSLHGNISAKSAGSPKVRIGAAKLGLPPLTAYVENADYVRSAAGSISQIAPPNYQQKSRTKKTRAGLKQFSRYVTEGYFPALAALVARLQAGEGWMHASAAVAIELGLPDGPIQSQAKNDVTGVRALPQFLETAHAFATKNEAYSKLLEKHDSIAAELQNAEFTLHELQHAYAHLNDEYRATLARSANQQRELINMGAVRGPTEASLRLIAADRAEQLERAELQLQHILNIRGWRLALVRFALANELLEKIQ